MKKLGLCTALLLLLIIGVLLLGTIKIFAATGINQELSFEGKIVGNSGINIPDGSYNVEFQIYTGCTSNTGTGCTSVWKEDYLVSNSQAVNFSSGIFQVNLGSVNPFGSSIPWNTYPLYLSIQIGNTSSCTPAGNFTANCGGDGVMSPYILLTSTPYSFNSGELGGLSASQFLQLQNTNPGTAQLGNFNLSGTGIANILQGITDIQSPSIDTPSSEALSIGSTNATTIDLNQNTVVATNKTLTVNGGVTFKDAIDSTTAFQVQDSLGTSNNLVIDTVNNLVGINETPTVGGNSFQVSGGITTSGNISLSTANSTITGSTGLTIAETGDQYGNVSMSLENRTGSNGAIFSNPSIDLVDFGFLPSSGAQQNIRYEHRCADIFGTNNCGGEFQIGPAANPNLIIGNGTTALRYGNLGVDTASPTATETIQTTSSTTNAFMIQNSSAVSILQFDSQTAQLIVGIPGSISGNIVLNSSGGTNTVGLTAPSTNPSSSYQLALPITVPSTNQCLESGSVTATQLTFASCSGTGGTGGVTSVGALDGGTANSSGATIVGTVMYLQSASSSYPGLVNNTAQFFSGAKTFNSSILIGTAGSSSGLVTFYSSGGTNTVGLTAPSTNPSGSYVLNLPISAPLVNQCLESGSTTATQLIFGACSSASGGISSIGTLDGGTVSANGAAISGSSLFLQSASVSDAGLVNTTTQSFAGIKSFTGTVNFAGGAAISSFLNGTWINLPTTGASGLGSGGAGNNAWIGYVQSTGEWYTNAPTGDIAYRNTSGGLDFGNTSGQFTMTVRNSQVGINLVTPTTLLDVNGPIATAISTETANYTITATDSTILASGTITITLPSASGITGREYTIKNIATGTITIASGGGTIDGATTLALSTQNESVTLQSNGTNWYVVAEVGTTIF